MPGPARAACESLGQFPKRECLLEFERQRREIFEGGVRPATSRPRTVFVFVPCTTGPERTLDGGMHTSTVHERSNSGILFPRLGHSGNQHCCSCWPDCSCCDWRIACCWHCCSTSRHATPAVLSPHRCFKQFSENNGLRTALFASDKYLRILRAPASRGRRVQPHPKTARRQRI